METSETEVKNDAPEKSSNKKKKKSIKWADDDKLLQYHYYEPDEEEQQGMNCQLVRLILYFKEVLSTSELYYTLEILSTSQCVARLDAGVQYFFSPGGTVFDLCRFYGVLFRQWSALKNLPSLL